MIGASRWMRRFSSSISRTILLRRTISRRQAAFFSAVGAAGFTVGGPSTAAGAATTGVDEASMVADEAGARRDPLENGAAYLLLASPWAVSRCVFSVGSVSMA